MLFEKHEPVTNNFQRNSHNSLLFMKSFWLLILLLGLGLTSSQNTEAPTPDLEGRNRVCDILIVIDSPLFELNDNNMSAVVEMAQDHVNGLNDIFTQQVFVEDYQSLYFHLKRVQVAYGSCDSPLFEEGIDANCTTQRGNYLKNFDEKTDTHEFCLAYMLTYLDFHNGTAGLASIGTLCRPKQNSGFVTLLNYGQERSLEESVITFAHEVAHNFNAIHDNDHEDDPECFKQGFIMDELLNVQDSTQENSQQFSPCSLKAMKKTLDTLETDCFRDQEFDLESLDKTEVALCGNMVVEAGEECDCGVDIVQCNDPCCYPQQIPDYERSANHSAR